MTQGRIIAAVISLCTLVIIAACGIESFIYLYPVNYRDFEPSSVSANNYFSFRTTDEKNEAESSGYFKGYEIYYRIYNNDAARVTDKSLINNYNSDKPTEAYSYLITTKQYQRLTCTVRSNDMPLIPGSTVNRQVIVRLEKYNDQEPQISVAGDTSLYGTPIRTNNGTLSTDKLFDLDEIDSGDSDFTYSATWDKNGTGKKLAYVEAYVLAYGYDESYKSLYSELFELGCITLTEK